MLVPEILGELVRKADPQNSPPPKPLLVEVHSHVVEGWGGAEGTDGFYLRQKDEENKTLKGGGEEGSRKL